MKIPIVNVHILTGRKLQQKKIADLKEANEIIANLLDDNYKLRGKIVDIKEISRLLDLDRLNNGIIAKLLEDNRKLLIRFGVLKK